MYGYTTVCALCAFMNLFLGYFVLLKEFLLLTAESLCNAREGKKVKTEKSVEFMREKEAENS